MRVLVKMSVGVSYVGKLVLNDTLLGLCQKESFCLMLSGTMKCKLLIPIDEIQEIYCKRRKYIRDEIKNFIEEYSK